MKEFLSDLNPGENVSSTAPSGYYCKPGSSPFSSIKNDRTLMFQECSSGHYCPSASEMLLCPDGSFCKKLVSSPTECDVMVDCAGAGNKVPGPAVLRAMFVFIVFGLLSASLIYLKIKTVLSDRDAKASALAAKEAGHVKAALVNTLFASKDMLELVGDLPPGFTMCQVPVSIKFRQLVLRVGEKKLLQEVSGTFRHSRMAAVMGRSGCGKSTLLNTLCGKATYGETEGHIFINEVEKPVTVLAPVMGFVPQDDTVHGDLTVLENISFSAQLRLPRTYSKQAKQAIVDGTMKALGLDPIANSIVGTVEKRGVSGGQKKRVNIGVEMVTDPTVLFLDEPTSGLGASDTLLVMKGLGDLTRVARTLVAVIHQPRYQVFLLFDDIMLLLPGGYTVYLGPSDLAEKWFNTLGFVTPKGENPADFFLDIISGLVPCPGNSNFKPEQLSKLWLDRVELPTLKRGDVIEKGLREHLNCPEKQELTLEVFLARAEEKLSTYFNKVDVDGSGGLELDEVIDLFDNMGMKLDTASIREEFIEMDVDQNGKVDLPEFLGVFRKKLLELIQHSKGMTTTSMQDMRTKSNAMSKMDVDPGASRVRPNLAEQFFILLFRAFMQKVRAVDEIIIHLALLMFSGLLVGILLSSEHQPFKPEDPQLALMMALIMSVMSTLSAVSSLKVFGYDKVMYLRESTSGISQLAYFSSKCLLDVVENVWQPAFFLGVCYNWIIPALSFGRFCFILMMCSFASSGLGILLSIVAKPGNMTIVTVLIALVVGIFVNGLIGIFYKDVVTGGLSPLWSVSFSRWAGEALLVGELESNMSELYQKLLVKESIFYYGYFPVWESREDWEASLPEGNEGDLQANRDWDDYFKGYEMRCYIWLVGIGLVLRVMSFFILAWLPKIIFWFDEKQDDLGDWLTENWIKHQAARKGKHKGTQVAPDHSRKDYSVLQGSVKEGLTSAGSSMTSAENKTPRVTQKTPRKFSHDSNV